MEVVQTLSVALGLAALSGYSLYLTVFLTGLAIHFDWIHLAPQYASLSVLGEPVIIIVAGALFVVEFFVDKVPWLDSIWDAIHTVIRPVGGALLAVQTLGHPGPVFDVLIALLAGSVTFTTHSVKAGTRLMVNQSPEPFSNVGVSLLENVFVGAGFALLWSHPIPALVVLLLFFAVALYFLPRIWRTIRIRIWFIRQKLNQPSAGAQSRLQRRLPHRYEHILRRLSRTTPQVAWAAPCISVKSPKIPGNRSGYLTATSDEPNRVFFLVAGWFGSGRLYEIDDFSVSLKHRFLFDELIFFTEGQQERYAFRFDRSQTGLAQLIVDDLEAKPRPTAPVQPLELTSAPGETVREVETRVDPVGDSQGSTKAQASP